MPDRAVYKSTAAEVLDELFGGAGDELDAAFDRSLELLANDAPLSEATSRLVETGELPPDAVENSTRGWRAGEDVDRILRCAYREAIAISRSRDEPLPIDTLWITGASDTFEVHLCEGTRQITLAMFIPVTRAYGSRNATARSWVLRAAGADDPSEARLPHDGEPAVAMVQTSGRSDATAD
jgi:hypothetical protein